MRTAVTGAFSYTGKYIARRLLDQGHEVITLTGHPERPDPFGGRVKAYPLGFDESELARSLEGAEVLYNTYWIRFDRGGNTQPRAVANTRTLVQAAQAAGVRRMVHVSITNPSFDSPLPYFSGKAANEQAVIASRMGYAILRPTVLFGAEDILINNIAWLLRRFPFFGQIGDGQYRLQPIYVDDLAALAVQAGNMKEDTIWDAVGPDLFTFDELIRLVGAAIGHPRPILHLPPRLALAAAQAISLFVRDVVLTPEEVDGLMAGLLVSTERPRGVTQLANWLEANRETVGRRYASELARHY
ncbi:MAG: NAD(P)H-binding protein [Anaerolineales bacterium]|nr:NAD(P)H-binding protein [Anaerolineales bacterium]